MSAYKKRTKKAEAKEKTTVEPLKKTIRHPVGLANYGANENRRKCHKCGSTASKCNNTRHVGRMIVRYRSCSNCGANRVTTEIAESLEQDSTM